MQKTQHKNSGNMKKQGNMTFPKVHKVQRLATNYKDIEMDEITNEEFKRMFIKMINEF